MAYSPGKLLLIVDNRGRPGVASIWQYRSQDAVTLVRGANYITDARIRGMKTGDLVYCIVTNSSDVPTGVQLMIVLTVAATGADLTDGTAITMTNT